jgi:hypothetical protein
MRRLLRAFAALLPAIAVVMALAACGRVAPGASPSPGSRTTQAPPAGQSTSPAAPATSQSAPASSSTAPPEGRTLIPGMTGEDVRQLQLRLAALKYFPGPADGRFGMQTLEAVWAFQEVQGLPPASEVGPAMRDALACPRAPAVLVPNGGPMRIEISLSPGVLVLYRAGQVALISHVSTGGGYYYCSPAGGCGYAVTPVGDYRTTAFIPGWVTVPLGEMYNPVFFIGAQYAIHGAADVPLQPASHGCVRIPMHIAEFFHHLVDVPGTPVFIRR